MVNGNRARTLNRADSAPSGGPEIDTYARRDAGTKLATSSYTTTLNIFDDRLPRGPTDPVFLYLYNVNGLGYLAPRCDCVRVQPTHTRTHTPDFVEEPVSVCCHVLRGSECDNPLRSLWLVDSHPGARANAPLRVGYIIYHPSVDVSFRQPVFVPRYSRNHRHFGAPKHQASWLQYRTLFPITEK